MCFLKGRSSEPHKLEHQVLECESYSKGLKGILGRNHKSKDSRIMDETREPPTVRHRGDFPDGSANSLNRLATYHSKLGKSVLCFHNHSSKQQYILCLPFLFSPNNRLSFVDNPVPMR